MTAFTMTVPHRGGVITIAAATARARCVLCTQRQRRPLQRRHGPCVVSTTPVGDRNCLVLSVPSSASALGDGATRCRPGDGGSLRSPLLGRTVTTTSVFVAVQPMAAPPLRLRLEPTAATSSLPRSAAERQAAPTRVHQQRQKKGPTIKCSVAPTVLFFGMSAVSRSALGPKFILKYQDRRAVYLTVQSSWTYPDFVRELHAKLALPDTQVGRHSMAACLRAVAVLSIYPAWSHGPCRWRDRCYCSMH